MAAPLRCSPVETPCEVVEADSHRLVCRLGGRLNRWLNKLLDIWRHHALHGKRRVFGGRLRFRVLPLLEQRLEPHARTLDCSPSNDQLSQSRAGFSRDRFRFDCAAPVAMSRCAPRGSVRASNRAR